MSCIKWIIAWNVFLVLKYPLFDMIHAHLIFQFQSIRECLKRGVPCGHILGFATSVFYYFLNSDDWNVFLVLKYPYFDMIYAHGECQVY